MSDFPDFVSFWRFFKISLKYILSHLNKISLVMDREIERKNVHVVCVG